MQFVEQSAFSLFICDILGYSSAFLLNISGFDVTYLNQEIFMQGTRVIHIGTPCNGLAFFGLFTCFVLAFPANLKSKAIFLPVGIVLIHLLNLFRVQFLVVNYCYFNSSFEFNHHYTFNVVVYGLMLILWITWARNQLQHHETATTH